MKMILHSEFPNGPFGDPVLYVWEINGKRALLFDCGDLTRLSTKRLLKVSHIFLSHCHMDHFFGFDLYLRVHVGSEKTTTIIGPPETSRHVGGKLEGYTWNLIEDQNLEFIVIDLDPRGGKKTMTHFHARNRFQPSDVRTELWNPESPVLDTGTYQVLTTMLDHRTPSMAYSIEEKTSFNIDSDVLRQMGLKPGSWINSLKRLFLMGGLDTGVLTVKTLDSKQKSLQALELANKLLIPRQRHKIAYVTDGSIQQENRIAILKLIQGADLLFNETCFLEVDENLAQTTKHFTAAFIGKLAQEAQVKKIAPFHFSKRYLDQPDKVLHEVAVHFQGEITKLAPQYAYPRL